MVAVLELSQTRGGFAQRAIAAPRARVESSRELSMSLRFLAPYRQLTERPARLISALAPSSSSSQGPKVAPSQATSRAEFTEILGCRLRFTTSLPFASK